MSKKSKIVKKLNYIFVKRSNTLMVITSIFSIFILFHFSNKNIKNLSNSIKQSNELLSIQKMSILPQFELTYRNANTSFEQVYIINTGMSKQLNLRTEYKLYFISNTNIYTEASLKRLIKEDNVIFNKVRLSGLITQPQNFNGLLGVRNEFYLSELNLQEETLLDISSSAIQNALRLAKALNLKIFTRWRVKYNEGYSNREIYTTSYFWLNQSNLEYSPRENLKYLTGGHKIIKMIENYENNSTEIIFDF